MRNRPRTSAASTAIAAISAATLLAAGGTRLLVVTASAASAPTLSLVPASLPSDGRSTAVVTISDPACQSLVGGGTATLSTDGASGFSTSASGPFTPTLQVSMASGSATAVVRSSAAGGLQNIAATFSPGLLTAGCTGTATAQLTEAGAPATITLDPLTPARLRVSAPGSTATATVHVLDAGGIGVPGEQVQVVRSGQPAAPISATDGGDGTYTATLAPAPAAQSETVVAVDVTRSPALTSAPQTLVSSASGAACSAAGLRVTPSTIVADGTGSATAAATFVDGGSPAAGHPVRFTTDGDLGVVSASPTTDPGGVASATMRAGYAVGGRRVTVTDLTAQSSCSGTVTLVNGTPGTAGPGQLSRFLYRAYQDVLHRSGDTPGVDYFGAAIAAGTSRARFALALATSDEHRTALVDADGTGLYTRYLGHRGDPAGVAYWVGRLRAGASDEAVAAEFLGSEEWFQQQGSDPGRFVDALYQTVLGRPGDAGRDYWLGALRQGASRTQVAYSLLTSPEALTSRIIGDYATYLGRGPGSVDALDYWIGVLQRGVPDENVAAAFIGSPEYLDRS